MNIVKNILKRLLDNGYEAFLVGGCVRDHLLKREINDFDITTNASPSEIKKLFDDYNVYSLGEKFGTIGIIVNNEKFEITTYRTEKYKNNFRKPDEICFTKSVKEDVLRRDFTINALLEDIDGNIIDFVNGKEDLHEGIIRCVGNPDDRFKEDALRILRAIRFAAKLNFDIEENTKKAMFKNKDLLKYVSKERITNEFCELLKTNNLKVIEAYQDLFYMLDFKVNKDLKDVDNVVYKLALVMNNLNNLALSKKEKGIILEIQDTYDIVDVNIIEKLSNLKYLNNVLEVNRILGKTELVNFVNKNKEYIIGINGLKISSNELIELGFKGKELGTIKKKILQAIHHKEISNNHKEILNFINKRG